MSRGFQLINLKGSRGFDKCDTDIIPDEESSSSGHVRLHKVGRDIHAIEWDNSQPGGKEVTMKLIH